MKEKVVWMLTPVLPFEFIVWRCVLQTGRLTAILACEDRMLRVIDKSTLSFSAPLSSPPTTIALLNNDGGDTGDKVVYATQDGQLGLIHVTR